ncbi:hypothetical protein RvY_16238 [Ramazzottius varieornatus]|uniref:Integral membrane protein GPR137B n=1 Tax=Ramazzottius varieornatus TaxID=947166 RepID=A0A1D1VZ36_RAMVA|nr:hypothetical protein RvY_16238 [Ramazzottius varieornatus]
MQRSHHNTPTTFSSITMDPTTTIAPFFPTIGPGLTPVVHQDLTIAFITLYCGLFLLAYIQLWLIFYYRHKRLSHQSVFLFSCLLWAGLRITLFSFYIRNTRLANDLPVAAYWLLYCFPVCIQFFLLCLLVLYFAQVLIKARVRYGGPRRYHLYLRVGMSLVMLLFLATDIIAAILKKNQNDGSMLSIIVARVAICDTLFILASVALSFCVYKLASMSSANILLEAKGATVGQATAFCVVTICLYVSRAIYDFIALSCPEKIPGFDYGWINVSNEGDLFNIHEGYGYLSFGLVLFFWEFLPTFLVVIFFRVRKPDTVVTTSRMIEPTGSQTTVSSLLFGSSRRTSIANDEITQSTGAIPSRTTSGLDNTRLTRSLTSSLNSPRRHLTYRPFGDQRAINAMPEGDEDQGPPVQTLATAGDVSSRHSLNR